MVLTQEQQGQLTKAADRGERAVLAHTFAAVLFEREEDRRDQIVDAFVDLMHFAHRSISTESVAQILESAQNHFEAEANGREV